MENKNYKLMLNAVKLNRESIDAMSDENVVAIKKTYACHFGTANENNEIVTKDSFDAMFKKMQGNGMMPSLNYMHTDTIIGAWTDLVPNSVGLQATGYLAKNNWDVRERILPLMDAGVPFYLSTEGFVPWDAMEWAKDGASYTCKQFDLIRISLVDVPADFQQKELERTNAIELHRHMVAEAEKENEIHTEDKPRRKVAYPLFY